MPRPRLRPVVSALAVAALALACSPGDVDAGADAAAPPAEQGTAAAAPAAEAASTPQGQADPEAAALAARVLDATGGEEGWAGARFVRFTFAGGRQHAWDRFTGQHRVEGETEDGEPYVVLHDLDTREGRAWVNGEEVTGERAAELLENAWGAWVNDTYWLLMPTKLRDPGVTLTHEGSEEIEGQTYEVLHLSFAGVGLTPGDQYWAYVDPETGQMDYWAFRLESMPADAEPVRWRWTGWQEYGPVRLAGRREQVGGDRVLELGGIEVSGTVPEGAFAAP